METNGNMEEFTVRIFLPQDPEPEKTKDYGQTAQYIVEIMHDVKRDCRRLASTMENHLVSFVERDFLALHTKSLLLSELELLLGRVNNLSSKEDILNEIDETTEDALDRMICVSQRYPSSNSQMRNLTEQASGQRWPMFYQICTKLRRYAERHEPSDPCTQMSNGK